MVIGLVGTTIAPWMQFYLQASIVEKGSPREQKASRLDVILGCLFTDVVAWFIIVACAATLYCPRPPQRQRADAAQALRPLAGEYAYLLFAPGPVQRVAVRRVDPCRSRRPTRSARAWDSSRASTRSSTRRRSSTGSTRADRGRRRRAAGAASAPVTSRCCRRSSTASCCRSC